MGVKEKMMSAMMRQYLGSMSAEEKQKMIERMMEQFMGTMSEDEKKHMMSAMMPKMMSNMMGGGANPMMGMMSAMMGKMAGRENASGESPEMPWDMCKKMMTNMTRATELASYATPELRGLFEEWLAQIEEEMRADVENQASIRPEELAQKYKLSKESVRFILGRLAQKEKINIKAEKK